MPTNADDAIWDINSANCTVNVSSVAKTVQFSSYTQTLTATSTLTVSGGITLGSGMTITGAGTLASIVTGTLTSNGKTWPGILQLGGTSQTYTFADNWTVEGNFNTSLATTLVTCNGNTLFLGGTGSTIIINRAMNGTTNLVLNGTSNFSGIGTLSNNLTINTSGTITFGSFNYGTGTFTYTAGNVISSAATLSILANCTLNIDGIVFNAISMGSPASQLIINSLLRTTTFTPTGINGSNIFLGTAGWDCDYFNPVGGGRAYYLTTGNTYTIRRNITLTAATVGSGVSSINSNTSGTKAILTFQQGATQDLNYINVTDIDSSLGKTLWTYKGTLTRTSNWNVLPTQPRTISYNI